MFFKTLITLLLFSQVRHGNLYSIVFEIGTLEHLWSHETKQEYAPVRVGTDEWE